MKKVKIIAFILVMSVMLTGAAYALWNQNITLATSAATGWMDVQVTCQPHIYPISYMPGLGILPIEDYMNPITGSVASDKQSITATVGDLYPGAEYGLDFTIKNTGDVPFRLSDVNVNCTANWALFSKLSGGFQFAYQSPNFAPRVITVPMTALSSATFGDAITAACANVVLYPGDELVGFLSHQDVGVTFMQVLVDNTIAGDDFENQTTTFTVDFVWEQCTPAYLGA